MTTEIATLTDEQDLERTARGLVSNAGAYQVVDAHSFANAGQMLVMIRAYTRRVHDVFDEVVDAAHKAHKKAVEKRKELLGPAEEAERVLKGRMGLYEQEMELQRRAAEAAARMEQERLEAEARAVAEAETKRLQALADEAALAVAIQAEEQGDVETAEQILAQPVFVPPVQPQPVFVPPVQVVQPQAAGVSFRDQYTFVIEDASLLPRAYLMPDEKKIGGVVRALREQAKIPGVKVIKTRAAAVRA